jgi:AcrR family transcriptional regulator
MREDHNERPERGDWRGFGHDESELDPADEGLRERKKRLTRSMISDTATLMFIQRGFDNVKITEIAAACGVSEKTIYNYFPTKESLVLDIEDEMTSNIERALGPGTEISSPVEATKALVIEQIRDLAANVRGTNQFDMATIRAFIDMINDTPSLRAAQFDMTERLAQVAARAMAARAGVDPEDPEPQIAADALLGLWRLYYRATAKYANEETSPSQFEKLVQDEVERAGRLIDTGLWSFAMTVQGTDSRDQLRIAAEASNEARKQVIRAIREAKLAWLKVTTDFPHETPHDRTRTRAADHRSAARRNAQEIREQTQQFKRDVHKAKQELRNEIREQVKETKRAAKRK